jgi:thioredoxin reductase (NADPH)
MAAEIKKEIELKIAHVLFTDIVGYSKLPINQQRALVERLNEIVRGTDEFHIAERAGQLLTIPTGDGVTLVFYHSLEAPVECALEISRALKKHPELQLRMGVHSGPVSGIIDATGKANVAGPGINIAQRVMDCGDAGHILLSKHVAEDLEGYPHWQPHLHELGECEVKHGLRVSVVNLYTEELGNPAEPEKLNAARVAAAARQQQVALQRMLVDEHFYRDTQSVAFPKLNDYQLSLLEPLGQRRVVNHGDVIYKAGQRDLGLTIVLRGEVEVFAQRDGTEQIMATARERDFIGDASMLQGTSTLASARVISPDAEILHVPATEIRRALAEIPDVSKTIVDALITRRRRLSRDREFAGMRVLAQRDERLGYKLDDFLDKNHIPHCLVIFESEEGKALSERFHLTIGDLPVLITPAGRRLRQPSLREVAQEAGVLRPLATGNENEILSDLTIVGAGPAGLAAAVHAASEGLNTVVLESYAPGGQAGSSSLIENFFGFPTGVSGDDLTWRAQLHAYRFGAKFSTPAQALSLQYDGNDEYRASLDIEGCSATLRAKAVLIATGADYRRIDAEGREQFENMGVYYAATAMEGQLCRNQTVVVVGSGNSAGQAAMFLSERAAKVLLVVRGKDIANKMSDYLARRVQAGENIEILYQREIRKMFGGKKLEEIELKNTQTGERLTVRTPAVFSMVGARPCTDWLPPEIERDDKGFIKTGTSVAGAPAWQANKHQPGPLETSLPAIFAAGDVRSGSVKRCAAAVGEGGMAVAGVQIRLASSS